MLLAVNRQERKAPCVVHWENAVATQGMVNRASRSAGLTPSLGSRLPAKSTLRTSRTKPETPKRVVLPTFGRLSHPCLLLQLSVCSLLSLAAARLLHCLSFCRSPTRN